MALHELEQITGSKLPDSQTTSIWHSLRPKLNELINNTLRDEYDQDLEYLIVDPLNPNYRQTVNELRDMIIDRINTKFGENPPFTINRLCELLIDPAKFCSNGVKYLNSIKCLVDVNSTIATFSNNFNSTKSVDNGEADDVLLSRIPWLTEDDIKEITSENYLVDEFPIASFSPDRESIIEEEALVAAEEEEYPIVAEDKKRKNEEVEEGDSIEKKYKSDSFTMEDVSDQDGEEQQPVDTKNVLQDLEME